MANNVTVEGGSLEQIIADTLKESEAAIRAASKEAAKQAAKATVKELKATSPKRKGTYAKGWKSTYQDGAYIVHNARLPGYTQLLENGHDIVADGVKVGTSPAEPHIKPAEQNGIKEFESLCIKDIERRLSQI